MKTLVLFFLLAPPLLGQQLYSLPEAIALGDGLRRTAEDAEKTVTTTKGNWTQTQFPDGRTTTVYRDDKRQVLKFDIRDPSLNLRIIGENAYPGNRTFREWSRRMPLRTTKNPINRQ